MGHTRVETGNNMYYTFSKSTSFGIEYINKIEKCSNNVSNIIST